MPKRPRFYRDVRNLEDAAVAIKELTDHQYELQEKIEPSNVGKDKNGKNGTGSQTGPSNSKITGINVQGVPYTAGQSPAYNAATGEFEPATGTAGPPGPPGPVGPPGPPGTGTVTGVTGTLPIVVTPATPNPDVSVNLATSSTVGVVKPDNSTITVDGAGILTATGGSGSSGFVYDEQVAGAGVTWTLAFTPVPSDSVQLYQRLAGFGGTLLIQSVDYTISTATITIISAVTPAAGDLWAWYRTTSLPFFEDNEQVAGSGTAWTLANTAAPARSLLLFQQLAGFGGTLLIQNIDYTISGTSITTVNSITAGTLWAFYRD